MSSLTKSFIAIIGVLAAGTAFAQKNAQSKANAKATISLTTKVQAGEGSVLYRKPRQNVVATIKQRLGNPDSVAFSETVASTRDPFVGEAVAQVDAPEASDLPTPTARPTRARPDTAEVEAEQPRVSAAQVLDRAGSTLQARVSGTLEAGGKLFMIPREGGFISPGSQIPVTEGETTFMVTIESISNRSFLLRLGNIQKRFPILDAAKQ